MSYCPITHVEECRCGDPMEKIGALAVDMRLGLRKLFTDHSVYTKMFIDNEIFKSGASKSISERLMQNQDEIGSYLYPVIGKARGKQLAALLKEHIQLAANCVKALPAGKNQVKAAVDRLMANSHEVSYFLHQLNPAKLPLEEITAEFDRHNEFVVAIAQKVFEKQFEEVIRLTDAYFNHMMMFSDMLFDASSYIDRSVNEQRDFAKRVNMLLSS